MNVENKVLPTAKALPGPNYKWWVVGMLWFICFFNYADRMAVNAVSTELQDEYKFTDEQIGLIISSFMWIYAITAPLAGQVGDRFNRKVLILGGLFVWSVVTAATAYCSKVWHFVFVRGSEGLGETFYFPATMSLVSDYHTKKTRSRAMGLHQTSVYAGTIGGTTLAGYLAELYDWRSPFIVFGICGMVLGVVLMLFLREPGRNEAERLESGAAADEVDPKAIPLRRFLGELLHTPSALLLVAAFFGANSVGLVFLSWMPKYLKDNFEMSLTMAGFSSSFYLQVASIIGSVIGGVLADRARLLHPGGRILTQSLGALLGIPFIYLSGLATDVVNLVMYLTLFGLAKGIYDANIWASMYDVVHPSRRATMLGLANMIGWFGAGCGTFGIGVATTRLNITMGQALASTSVIYAVVAILLLVAGLAFAPRDIRRAATAADAEAAALTH
ncbi:MAG: MFS transporter [Planctomycetaceae bacterium]